MKKRSNSYLRTFPNTPEGNLEYKCFISDCRNIGIVGGRFIKMFRGGTRNYRWFNNYKGERVRWGGSCSLNDGTHFDVYLYGGRWVNGKRTEPRFFNFVLEDRPR